MDYSLPLAQWLANQGCTLYAKSDRRFLEGVYRVLRDAFNYHPKLTRGQFLANGYAERKVMLTCDFLLLCQAKHLQLTKKRANIRTKWFEKAICMVGIELCDVFIVGCSHIRDMVRRRGVVMRLAHLKC